MITMTEFIEKVDAIMGQQMDDTKANQLCRLYAMIYDRGKNSGYNICVGKACDLLRDLGVFTEDFINDFRKDMKESDMTEKEKEKVEALYKSCALGIFGKQFSCTLCKETVEHDDCDACPISLTMEEYNRNAKILISPDKPKEFAIATCISKEDLYDEAYSNGMSEGLKIGRESCSQILDAVKKKDVKHIKRLEI